MRTTTLLLAALVIARGGPFALAEAPRPADALGDPLPEGAVARLGSARFRHVGGVRSLIWIDDARLLSAGSGPADGYLPPQIRIWEVPSGRPIEVCSTGPGIINSVAWSASGHAVLAIEGEPVIGFYAVHGALAGRESQAVPADSSSRFRTVALSPDGLILAAGRWPDEVVLWDRSADGSFVERDAKLEGAEWISFASDGALFSASRQGSIRRWDVGNLEAEEIASAADDWAFPVALSRDGTTIAAATLYGRVLLWSVRSRRLLRALTGAEVPVTALAVDGDGKRLAWAEARGGVHLVEVADGREVAFFDAGMFASALAFSPDGATLASGNGTTEGAIRLWNLASGVELTREAGHASPPAAIEFSPDGSLLASGGDDRTVRLWEVSSGRCLECLRGHRGPARHLRFSRDGAMLASTEPGHCSGVRVWRRTQSGWAGAGSPRSCRTRPAWSLRWPSPRMRGPSPRRASTPRSPSGRSAPPPRRPPP